MTKGLSEWVSLLLWSRLWRALEKKSNTTTWYTAYWPVKRLTEVTEHNPKQLSEHTSLYWPSRHLNLMRRSLENYPFDFHTTKYSGKGPFQQRYKSLDHVPRSQNVLVPLHCIYVYKYKFLTLIALLLVGRERSLWSPNMQVFMTWLKLLWSCWGLSPSSGSSGGCVDIFVPENKSTTRQSWTKGKGIMLLISSTYRS